jgi:hypothetical protein
MDAWHRRTSLELCGSPLRRTAPNLVRWFDGRFLGAQISAGEPDVIVFSGQAQNDHCWSVLMDLWTRFVAVRRLVRRIIGRMTEILRWSSAVRRRQNGGSTIQNLP